MFVIITNGYMHEPGLDWLTCIYMTMSRGTSHLVEFNASLYSTSRATPRLMKMMISTENF